MLYVLIAMRRSRRSRRRLKRRRKKLIRKQFIITRLREWNVRRQMTRMNEQYNGYAAQTRARTSSSQWSSSKKVLSLIQKWNLKKRKEKETAPEEERRRWWCVHLVHDLFSSVSTACLHTFLISHFWLHFFLQLLYCSKRSKPDQITVRKREKETNALNRTRTSCVSRRVILCKKC